MSNECLSTLSTKKGNKSLFKCRPFTLCMKPGEPGPEFHAAAVPCRASRLYLLLYPHRGSITHHLIFAPGLPVCVVSGVSDSHAAPLGKVQRTGVSVTEKLQPDE